MHNNFDIDTTSAFNQGFGGDINRIDDNDDDMVQVENIEGDWINMCQVGSKPIQ